MRDFLYDLNTLKPASLKPSSMIHIRTLIKFLCRNIIISLITISTVPGLDAAIPRPDHVVVCILENHEYHSIIGGINAPFFNALASQGAQLDEYYALTHPSQPNYIMLFSGSNQGETTDNLPSGTPWTTPNLGAAMIQAGFTFGAYSEDLPHVGSTVGSSGAYARKHCPWVNWQGTGTNQMPASVNMSMTEWPTDFSNLPDLSFIIPNQNNDMHNGTDPVRITTSDLWIETKLQAYASWAMQNNSLLIITFDEDDRSGPNHIPCIFIGPMVRVGSYAQIGYDHYDLLHTFSDIWGLPYFGHSANAQSIEEIWLTLGVNEHNAPAISQSQVFPNPVASDSRIQISNRNVIGESVRLQFYDIAGRIKSEEKMELLPGTHQYAFKKEELQNGIYTYRIANETEVFGIGKVIVN